MTEPGQNIAPRLAQAQCQRAGFLGDLLMPADAYYPEARQIWNAAIAKRPGLIARCRRPADIQIALAVARENSLEVSLRGGGHNIAGTALTDGGVMIDLSLMRNWKQDPERGTIDVEMGMTWRDYDAATQTAGRATPGGIVSATGIAGLSLGGGFGWLSRQFGWTCDSLIRATLIMADGVEVTAAEEENHDLLWALRGGGGNFGIVRQATFATYPVGAVFAGSLVWRMDDAAPALSRCSAIMEEAPESACLVISLGPPPAAFDTSDVRVLRVSLCENAGETAGLALVSKLTRGLRPAFRDTRMQTYQALQTMLDAGARYGFGHYAKSLFLTKLDDSAIDVLVHGAAGAPSHRSRLVLHACGGRAGARDAPDTAFGHRDAAYNLQIDATWEIGADQIHYLRWAREVHEKMRPWGRGVYVNFLGADADSTGVFDAYGSERLVRLRRIKQAYDPTNVFHVNQNIAPFGLETTSA